MRRRQFIQMTAFLAAAGSLNPISALTPAFASPDVTMSSDTALLADRLLKLHVDPVGASAIGQALMQDMPLRPDIDHVIQALMGRLGIPAGQLLALSTVDLRSRLEGKTAEDFRLGRTSTVQGWLLGETETWACALAALRIG